MQNYGRRWQLSLEFGPLKSLAHSYGKVAQCLHDSHYNFPLVIARGTPPAVPNIASSDRVPEGITEVTRARQQDTD